MSIQRRTFLFVTLGLIVWSMAATLAAAYYYTQYIETRKTFEDLNSLVINANVLMDYGNGTQYWYNETVIAGSTAFDALLAATKNVDYTIYSFGVYVTSINGIRVEGTPTSGYAWLWYYWNATTSKWIDLYKAADAYILKPNDSITWRYEYYSF
jgi:hypothetical protein